ncbi:MAG: hypothetical protein V3W51_07140 [Candidatus Brocadiales bacterium]
MEHTRWTDELEVVDGLLAKGKGVRGMFGSSEGLQEEAFEEWRTGSLDFIMEQLGEDSQLYMDFHRHTSKATLSTCNIGIGILTAVKRSLVESHDEEAGLSTLLTAATRLSREEAKDKEEKAQLPKEPGLRLEDILPEEPATPETKTPQQEPPAEEPAPAIIEEQGADKPPSKVIVKKGGQQPPEQPHLKLEDTPAEEAPATGPKTAEKKPTVKKPRPVAKKIPKEKPSGAADTSTVSHGVEKPPQEAISEKVSTQPPEHPVSETQKTSKKHRPVKNETRKAEPPSGMDIQEDILWQAQVQLSQGRKDAAAVLCGAVLEEILKCLCIKHNIPTREWDTIGDLSNKLLSQGVYDESTHSKFISWWYLREDAHAVNFDAYSKPDVADMINGVHDFLKKCFSTSTARAARLER